MKLQQIVQVDPAKERAPFAGIGGTEQLFLPQVWCVGGQEHLDWFKTLKP